MHLLNWLNQIIAQTGSGLRKQRSRLPRFGRPRIARRATVQCQAGSIGWGHSAIDIERLEDRTLLAVVDVVGNLSVSQFSSLIAAVPSYKEWGNEPFIAVNPTNPNRIVVSGFAYGTDLVSNGAAVYYSTDAGATWTMTFPFQAPADGISIPRDQTFAYDSSGNLHGVFLGSTSSGANIYHAVVTNPAVANSAVWTVGTVNAAGINGTDQPYMAISNGHVYIGYDDFTAGGFIRVARSDDNGVTFSAVNDLPISYGSSGQPANGFTNPGVRVATDAAGNGYAIYGMSVSSPSTGVQDVTWGLNSYMVGTSGSSWDHTTDSATPGGILIDTGTSHQIDGTGATWFGGINELRGNTTAIAVSRAGDHIYAVYGKQDAFGLDRLYVEEFHPGAGTLIGSGSVVFSVPGQRAALPSIAVTDNGTVFLEYTSYVGPGGNPLLTGGTFQVHLASSTDLCQTFADQVLYSYTKPANPGDPGFSTNRLLGDYNYLTALGDKVYGTFPARGNVIAGPINSTGLISPFYFSASAVNTVTVTSTPASVAENSGSPITYTFTRTGSTALDLPVVFTFGGAAQFGLDFNQTGATIISGNTLMVTIPAGASTVDVTVTPVNDTVVESDETVDVTVSLDTAYLVGTTNVASSIITDIDTATVRMIASIDGVESAVPTNGRLRATMTATSSTDTVVNYSVSGTALNGTDYTTITGTVTILAGSTFANIDILVLDDLIIEGVETVSVTATSLGAHDPQITLTPTIPNRTATINITEDDASTVSISKVFDGAETNSPTPGRFRITQTLVSTTPTVVTYTVAGTATAGSDYTTLSGTATIPASATFVDVDVPVLNDNLVELTETVIVTLTGVVGNPQITVLSKTSSFQGQFDPATWSFNAGAVAGSVNTAGAPPSISLTSGNNGFGAGDTDYTHTILTAGSITFNWSYTTSDGANWDYPQYTINGVATLMPGFSTAGGTTQSGTASILVAVGQTFGLRMHTVDATGGAATTVFSNFFAPGTPSATVNITDDDAATVSIVKLVDGAEGATPVNAQFQVTQTVASSTATNINYSIGGTSTNTADFTTLTGTVQIPAGQLTALINVAVLNDALVEPTETVVLTLTGFGGHDSDITLNASPAAITASADITDDDVATVLINKISDGAETNTPTNGKFRVFQTAQSSTNTVINYTIGGTATNGADYTTLTGTVTVVAGQLSADIDVLVTNDNIIESTENVIVTLTGFTAHDAEVTLDASPSNLTATVSITDNDTATVSIAKITDGIESAVPTNGLFRITQTARSSTDTVINYSIVGSATPGSDYVVLTGSATIPAGSTTVDIPVTVLNDAIIEGTETVVVTLTSFAAHDPKVTFNTVPSNLTATVNITDTDAGTVSIAKITDGIETATPTNGLFRITQTAVSTTNTIIAYSIAGTATADSDYVALTGTATIVAGQTSVDIDVTVLNDTLIEGVETVIVTLTSLTSSDPDITLDPVVANRTATVNIVDVEGVSISKILDGAESTTPTNGRFRLLQSTTSPTDTVVNYSITGTATPGGDYVTLTGTATILAGTTTTDIDVTVLDDLFVESTEGVVVTLTSLGAHDPGLSLDPTPANLVATVDITDNDLPTISSVNAASIAENSAASTVLLDVDVSPATIPGLTITYGLAGTDATLFTIDSATGEIRFIASPNFEAPGDVGANNVYNITVTASANTVPPQVGSQAVTITVTPVNDNAPVVTSLSAVSFPESSPIATVVLDVNATDADRPNQSLTYNLSGPDANLFDINATTGEITFKVSPNYEVPTDTTGADNVYEVTVTVTDDGTPTLFGTQDIDITVTPVNDIPPLVTSPSTADFAENTPATSVALDANAIDADIPGQSVSFSLSGPDAALFTIDPVSGEIRFKTSPNYEAPADQNADNFYQISLIATDDGTPSLSSTQLVTIHVTPVNDNTPAIVSLAAASFPENSLTTAVALDVNATDADLPVGALIYSLSGADSTLFNIDSSNGQITFKVSPNFEAPTDQGTNNVYDLIVTVNDSAVGGFSAQQAVTITVTNVNEVPSDIALSSNTVVENQPAGTPIGTFSSTDPDAGDTFIYTLAAGVGSTDNASFVIVNGELRTGLSFDYETKSTYSIRVRSRDIGGLNTEKVFTITILDTNDAPTEIAVTPNTVPENQSVGTVVGTLSSSDQDAIDSFTYALVSGTGSSGNSSFTILGSQLKTAASFNFEAQPTYTIRVRSTDAGGLSVERIVTVNITNVNELPTDISLSKPTVAENQAAGALVGNFITTDQDAGDTFSYVLVSGAGADDNASFAISNGQLVTVDTFDFETKATYSIRVQSTDAGGLSTQKILTVGITNVNEKPTAFTLIGTTVPENQPVGTTVGSFSTTDIDVGDTFTYSLVLGTGDADNDLFTIAGDELRTAVGFDFETGTSYSIRVRSRDAGGLFIFSVFTITVTNVNDQPTDLALSNNTITENQPAGTTVGTLSTTDIDVGDTFTYQLVSGAGSGDNASFVVVGNQLQTAGSLNFEAKSIYSVRVRSTDSGGLSTEKALTINVTNLNEAPTDIGLSTTVIAENQAVGSTIGTLSTSDPDFANTFTYSLVSGAGSTDNASFNIVGGQLVATASFDFETKSTYSIRLRSTDGNGLSFDKIFTITVTDVNDAPSNVALTPSTVAENSAAGTVVGSLSTTDQDGGTFTYSLVPGVGATDNSNFTLSGSQIKTASTFNFENKSSYSIRVRSTDAGGLSTEKILTVAVTNVNEAPDSVSISSEVIDENQAVGTQIGTLSTTDIDLGDAFSYALVSGTGSTGNAAFTIVGDRLLSAQEFDFETQASYSVRVRSTDANGLTVDKILTIQIADVADLPEIILTPEPVNLPRGKGGVIDLGANVADQDTTNFQNNRITVGVQAADQQPADRLRVIPQGKGADRLKVVKGNLKLGKTVIGTATGGRDGAALSITFTQSTSAATVQRVLNHIGFKSPGSNSTPRHVEFQMFDANGNSNPPVVKEVIFGS